VCPSLRCIDLCGEYCWIFYLLLAQLFYLVTSLCPSCACWPPPVHWIAIFSPLLSRLGDFFQALQYCNLHAHSLPLLPVLELDPERGSHPISSASRQQAASAGIHHWDMRLSLLAISLTRCRLNNIRKEVLQYFLGLFFIVFKASQWENSTRCLLQSVCGRTALGLRLISACVRPLLMLRRRAPCHLTPPCLSQLGSSQDFLSFQSLLGGVGIS